jgi:hypothetical protein
VPPKLQTDTTQRWDQLDVQGVHQPVQLKTLLAEGGIIDASLVGLDRHPTSKAVGSRWAS